MTSEESIKLGFAERSDIPYPMGGDYTEAHFFDTDGNPVKKDEAALIVLKIFTADGTQIGENLLYNEEKTRLENIVPRP